MSASELMALISPHAAEFHRPSGEVCKPQLVVPSPLLRAWSGSQSCLNRVWPVRIGPGHAAALARVGLGSSRRLAKTSAVTAVEAVEAELHLCNKAKPQTTLCYLRPSLLSSDGRVLVDSWAIARIRMLRPPTSGRGFAVARRGRSVGAAGAV